MKHTDYEKEMMALNKTIEAELRLALKAHGGKYTFPDTMLGPYVDIPGKPLNKDVWCIKTVKLDKDGYFQLTAVPEKTPASQKAKVLYADLDFLTISYIIDEMDDTKAVNSVLIPRKTNPEIVFRLTCNCYSVLHSLGIEKEPLKADILDKAEELSGLLESREIKTEDYAFKRIMSEQERLFIMSECRRYHIGEIHHLPHYDETTNND